MVMSQGPGAWWENRQGRRAGSVRMRSRLWKSEGLEFGDLEGLMWNRGTFCTRPGLFPQVYKPSCLFLIWSQIFWSLSVKFELRLRLLSLVRPCSHAARGRLCWSPPVLGADSASQIAPSPLPGIRNSSSSLFNGNVEGAFNIWSNIYRITETWQICVTRFADTRKSQNDTENEKPDEPNLIWSTNQADVVIPESRELLIRLNRHPENKPKETDNALVWLFTSLSLSSLLPSSSAEFSPGLLQYVSPDWPSRPAGIFNLKNLSETIRFNKLLKTPLKFVIIRNSQDPQGQKNMSQSSSKYQTSSKTTLIAA